MIYKCEMCREVFDESKAVTRDDGNYEEFWGSKMWMPYLIDVCPYCGSEDIGEYVEDFDGE